MKLFFEWAEQTDLRFRDIFVRQKGIDWVLQNKSRVFLLDTREAKIINDFYGKQFAKLDKTSQLHKSKHAFLPLEEAVLFSRRLNPVLQKEIKNM